MCPVESEVGEALELLRAYDISAAEPNYQNRAARGDAGVCGGTFSRVTPGPVQLPGLTA
ncbi:hypothetical protein [Streptomyces collinus]|uniref:hypothetical protein n=1 Tax=Streptomyces collinus TaxID=42684 RepID=UPI0037F8ED91